MAEKAAQRRHESSGGGGGGRPAEPRCSCWPPSSPPPVPLNLRKSVASAQCYRACPRPGLGNRMCQDSKNVRVFVLGAPSRPSRRPSCPLPPPPLRPLPPPPHLVPPLWHTALARRG